MSRNLGDTFKSPDVEPELTPKQKAARTRAANKAAKEIAAAAESN